MGFQLAVAVNPAGPGFMALAPKRLEHPLGSFDLLQGGREGVPSLRQVGDVADKEPADASLLEHSLQQHHDRLLIGIPTLGQYLAQEFMTNGKELRPGTLSILADFLS